MERYVTSLVPGTKVKLTKHGKALLKSFSANTEPLQEYTLLEFDNFYGWWLIKERFDNSEVLLMNHEFEVIEEEN